MRIAILGYSGSGKSTLCDKLADKYALACLHMDEIQFIDDWKERPQDEKQLLIDGFLDNNRHWVIDGNYFDLSFERRMEEAETIIILQFSRLNCLWRCFKRYLKYRGESRPGMADGCKEKFDLEFISWILFGGRSAGIRKRYRRLNSQYPEKAVILRNQKQVDMYLSLY